MFINCSHIESIFMDVPPHPSGLDERVVAKVFARRGRLHAYESLNPAGTALVAKAWAVVHFLQASRKISGDIQN